MAYFMLNWIQLILKLSIKSFRMSRTSNRFETLTTYITLYTLFESVLHVLTLKFMLSIRLLHVNTNNRNIRKFDYQSRKGVLEFSRKTILNTCANWSNSCVKKFTIDLVKMKRNKANVCFLSIAPIGEGNDVYFISQISFGNQ